MVIVGAVDILYLLTVTDVPNSRLILAFKGIRHNGPDKQESLANAKVSARQP